MYKIIDVEEFFITDSHIVVQYCEEIGPDTIYCEKEILLSDLNKYAEDHNYLSGSYLDLNNPNDLKEIEWKISFEEWLDGLKTSDLEEIIKTIIK